VKLNHKEGSVFFPTCSCFQKLSNRITNLSFSRRKRQEQKAGNKASANAPFATKILVPLNLLNPQRMNFRRNLKITPSKNSEETPYPRYQTNERTTTKAFQT